MQKWEYMVIKVVKGVAYYENDKQVGKTEKIGWKEVLVGSPVKKSTTLTDTLNSFGADGWEIMSLSNLTDSLDCNILLKRPKKE